jgi:hypothetical protein
MACMVLVLLLILLPFVHLCCYASETVNVTVDSPVHLVADQARCNLHFEIVFNFYFIKRIWLYWMRIREYYYWWSDNGRIPTSPFITTNLNQIIDVYVYSLMLPYSLIAYALARFKARRDGQCGGKQEWRERRGNGEQRGGREGEELKKNLKKFEIQKLNKKNLHFFFF